MTVPVSRLHAALRSADRRSSTYVTVQTAVVTCRLAFNSPCSPTTAKTIPVGDAGFRMTCPFCHYHNPRLRKPPCQDWRAGLGRSLCSLLPSPFRAMDPSASALRCCHRPMQNSRPAGWLAFTGRELNPLDRDERFPSCYISSPFPGFILTLPSFRRSPFAHDVFFDPGRAVVPRVTALLMLHSTRTSASAPAMCPFRGS